jgi:PEGA domain
MVRRRDGNRGRKTRAILALTALLAFSLPGCVERRYTIRSDPPGALVVVNNEEIGRTPVSKSFIFYKDREITLMMDGFQTKKVIEPIRAPWYDNMITEVITENFLPVTIRDEREFMYKLDPVTQVPRDELIARADTLRIEAQSPPKPRRGGILGWLGF